MRGANWKPSKAAEGEDMVGIAAAIGVVAARRNVALVIEQRVQHMQRLARRRRDQLGVERCVAVGEVGVDLEARLVAVMGVELRRHRGRSRRPGRTGRPTTKRMPPPNVRRERLALLLVDQAPQRQGIGFVADVPVRRPGELAEAGDAAGLGHARQAEIEPVGEQTRHQDAAVGGGLAGAQMGEAVGNSVQPATSASRSVMRMRGSMA